MTSRPSRLACTSGAIGRDAGAQLELGIRYATGKGIPPDERTTLRWIGIAAAQDHAAAQLKLGNYYATWQWAGERLRQSALQGFVPAQISLALLYLTGADVPVDQIEAYAWLGRAAE